MEKKKKKEMSMFDFFSLDPDKTLKKAQELKNEGKFEKALSLIKKALKGEPEHSFLNLSAFELCLILQDIKSSFLYFQKAFHSKETKEAAERLLRENLALPGLNKHREVYFESLIEELRLKEAREFFENLKKEEIEAIREKYRKIVENLGPIGEKALTKVHLRGFLVNAMIEWEQDNIETSRVYFKQVYKYFKDSRELIKDILQEEAKFGRKRAYALFLLAELLYTFETEKDGIVLFEKLKEIEPSIVEKFYTILKEKPPCEDEGKKLYAEVLLKRGEIEQAVSYLLELSEKEEIRHSIYDLSSSINIEKARNAPSLLHNLIKLYINLNNLKGIIISFGYFKEHNREKALSLFPLLVEKLSVKFDASAIRKFLEILKDDEELCGEFLKGIVEKNASFLYEREFPEIIDEVFQKIPASEDILSIFSLALLKSGRLKEGLYLAAYLLQEKKILPPSIKKFLEEKKSSLADFHSFYELSYEDSLREGKEGYAFLKEYIEKFPENKNLIFVFLDECSLRNPEANKLILKDIENLEKIKGVPQTLVNFLRGEIYLREKKYTESGEYYFKSFTQGLKWANIRAKELKEQDIPEIDLLNAKIAIQEKKFNKGRELLKKSLKGNPLLLKEVANFLREKIKGEKNFYLALIYLEILSLQGFYDAALAFGENLMKTATNKEYEADIQSLYAQALWNKGDIKSAQTIIKKLLLSGKKFDYSILINFLERKISEGEELPFLFQSLGTLSAIAGDVEKSSLAYFNLAVQAPHLIPRIEKMLFSIYARYPENKSIRIALCSLRLFNIQRRKDGILELEKILEENHDENAPFLIKFLTQIKIEDDPAYLLLCLKIYFYLKDVENFRITTRKIFYLEPDEDTEEKTISLMKTALSENLLLTGDILLLYRKLFEKKRYNEIFEIFKSKEIPREKDIQQTIRDLLLSIDNYIKENPQFNLYLGNLLLKLRDKRCINFYTRILNEYAKEIESKFEEIKEIENGALLGAKVSFILKDFFKFFERIKLSIKGDEYFKLLKEAMQEFPYTKEFYQYLYIEFKEKGEKQTVFEILKEIAEKEKDILFIISHFIDFARTYRDDEKLSIIFKILLEKHKDSSILAHHWEKIYNEAIDREIIEKIKKQEKDIELAILLRKRGRLKEAKEILEKLPSDPEKEAKRIFELSLIMEKECKLLPALFSLEEYCRKTKSCNKDYENRIHYLRKKIFGNKRILSVINRK